MGCGELSVIDCASLRALEINQVVLPNADWPSKGLKETHGLLQTNYLSSFMNILTVLSVRMLASRSLC